MLDTIVKYLIPRKSIFSNPTLSTSSIVHCVKYLVILDSARGAYFTRGLLSLITTPAAWTDGFFGRLSKLSAILNQRRLIVLSLTKLRNGSELS